MAGSLIVHPTDLLPETEAAFDHALRLALAGRSRLILVHVHGYDAEQAPQPNEFPHVRRTLARWGLLAPDAAEAEVAGKLGVELSKGELLAMDPEAGLLKLLADRHAAMMVLGTRGLAGLRRLFEGSFSEKLTRDARIPALFVPHGAAGFVDPKDGSVRLDNILVPVAERPDPAGAVAAAAGLARLLGADSRFHLLHVGASHPFPAVSLPAGARRDDMVRDGPVVETIVEAAEETRADLIVMATAGHKSFLDALRGSTTEAVLRAAHRPLLAVPAQ